MLRSTFLPVTIACACLACGEQIEVDNAVATLNDVGDVSLTSYETVAFSYTLADQESDDQQLIVEVCEGSAEMPTACGLAFEGAGSDGVTFVPTQIDGAELKHRFAWAAGCGRVSSEGNALETNLATAYVFRIRVRSEQSGWSYTPSFTLSGLGLSTLPDCPR